MPAWDVSGWTLPQVYRVYRLLPSFTVFCDVDQMKPSFATIQLKGEIQVDLVLKNSKRMLSRIFKGNSDLLSLTVSLLPKLVLFCTTMLFPKKKGCAHMLSCWGRPALAAQHGRRPRREASLPSAICGDDSAPEPR